MGPKGAERGRKGPKEARLHVPHPSDSFRAPMARVTVEDCLEREDNRFALVVLAAARTRQLMKGAPPLVRASNKPSVIALREVAAGRVRYHRESVEVVREWLAERDIR